VTVGSAGILPAWLMRKRGTGSLPVCEGAAMHSGGSWPPHWQNGRAARSPLDVHGDRERVLSCKSLCFQLPALARDGLALVVSPLIARMKDRVDALTASGVPATLLNSSIQGAEAQRSESPCLTHALAAPPLSHFVKLFDKTIIILSNCLSQCKHSPSSWSFMTWR